MTATTPFLKNEDRLGSLDSRYVAVDSLPWKPTPCPGIDMKILLEDKETGLMTALFRWQPGAELARDVVAALPGLRHPAITEAREPQARSWRIAQAVASARPRASILR
jgi:hypothetical protein